MRRLIEFPLEAGGSVLIQVQEPAEEADMTRAGRVGEAIVQAHQTFEATLERLRPVADAIIARLRGLADPPDEVQVEFGVALSAEAGVVITSASAEANYRVTLTWRR
ncbi:MAG: CU044_2847 family protein [Anaerolineae bacterium]|nr:hypothetical protein [Anaerolineae bacterium]MDW8099448.1 CU044_2847 family protein [Anaerolineae bacterium]